jgi:hypothetical protein
MMEAEIPAAPRGQNRASRGKLELSGLRRRALMSRVVLHWTCLYAGYIDRDRATLG